MTHAGRRVPDETGPHTYEPGDYGRYEGGWYGRCPGDVWLLAGLSRHRVVENADGTISVSPSILCGNGKESWHGFLTDGVWQDA